MSDQLILQWSAQDRDRDRYDAIHEVVVEVIARASLKETAYRLDVSDKALGHALARRDRHYVRFDWLPAVMEIAGEHGLAERLGGAIVAPAQLVVSAAQPLTAEQKLARLESAIRNLGHLGEVILADAGLK